MRQQKTLRILKLLTSPDDYVEAIKEYDSGILERDGSKRI